MSKFAYKCILCNEQFLHVFCVPDFEKFESPFVCYKCWDSFKEPDKKYVEINSEMLFSCFICFKLKTKTFLSVRKHIRFVHAGLCYMTTCGKPMKTQRALNKH